MRHPDPSGSGAATNMCVAKLLQLRVASVPRAPRSASGDPAIPKLVASNRTTLATERNGGSVMRHGHMILAATATAALLTGAAPAARADGWIGSWGASDVFPVGQDINDQTLRQIVRLSAGGSHVR